MRTEEICKQCLDSSYFLFKDTFFEQVEGAAMGPPLSPIVANLNMEAFEWEALGSATLKSKMWVCYVDDTFFICPHHAGALKTFHTWHPVRHERRVRRTDTIPRHAGEDRGDSSENFCLREAHAPPSTHTYTLLMKVKSVRPAKLK